MIHDAKSQIVPLTSARFFAAMFVVSFHVFAVHKDGANALQRLINLGFMGVTFFFVLSGFILAFVYLKSVDGKLRIDRKMFFWSRLARIYPMYLAAMLLDFPHFLHSEVMVKHQGAFSIASTFLVSLALMQTWVNQELINLPSWSLSAEAFFYITFAFLATNIWRMRAVTMWVFGVAVYVIALWLSSRALSMHIELLQILYNPIGHVSQFMVGICLCKGYFWIIRDGLRRAAFNKVGPWLLLLGASMFAALPLLRLSFPEVLLQHGLLVPVFCILILGLASGNHAIAVVLGFRWLVTLGEASYALYLIHIPIYILVGRRLVVRYGWAGMTCYFAIILLLSILCFRYLETPARTWILKRVHQLKWKETTVTGSLAQ